MKHFVRKYFFLFLVGTLGTPIVQAAGPYPSVQALQNALAEGGRTAAWDAVEQVLAAADVTADSLRTIIADGQAGHAIRDEDPVQDALTALRALPADADAARAALAACRDAFKTARIAAVRTAITEVCADGRPAAGMRNAVTGALAPDADMAAVQAAIQPLLNVPDTTVLLLDQASFDAYWPEEQRITLPSGGTGYLAKLRIVKTHVGYNHLPQDIRQELDRQFLRFQSIVTQAYFKLQEGNMLSPQEAGLAAAIWCTEHPLPLNADNEAIQAYFTNLTSLLEQGNAEAVSEILRIELESTNPGPEPDTGRWARIRVGWLWPYLPASWIALSADEQRYSAYCRAKVNKDRFTQIHATVEQGLAPRRSIEAKYRKAGSVIGGGGDKLAEEYLKEINKLKPIQLEQKGMVSLPESTGGKVLVIGSGLVVVGAYWVFFRKSNSRAMDEDDEDMDEEDEDELEDEEDEA